eukprot:4030744-Amphidinium_carterae.1
MDFGYPPAMITAPRQLNVKTTFMFNGAQFSRICSNYWYYGRVTTIRPQQAQHLLLRQHDISTISTWETPHHNFKKDYQQQRTYDNTGNHDYAPRSSQNTTDTTTRREKQQEDEHHATMTPPQPARGAAPQWTEP